MMTTAQKVARMITLTAAQHQGMMTPKEACKGGQDDSSDSSEAGDDVDSNKEEKAPNKYLQN